MGLKDLELKFKYRSDQDRIYKDFYEKCIQNAKQYYRAVGYFTSGSLQLIARGLIPFIERDGRIRIIANPYFNHDDIKAIEKGYKAKEDIILKTFLNELEISKNTIEEDILNILAWLIYEKKLEIKIAYSNDINCLYHEKFGIFSDEEGISVAFSGSANETIGGIKNNFEKIDVFFSEEDKMRIEDMKNDFDNLWENNTNGIEIISIPKAITNEILKYRNETKPDIKIYETKNQKSIKTKEITPRGYQQEAIQAFKANNWEGILEMATGTGKTITSLLIAKDFLETYSRIYLIIMVPFVHLISQWEQNCIDVGFTRILNCTGSKKDWQDKLSQNIRDYNIGITQIEVILTTYRTACSEVFNDQISSIKGRVFLIADECHYFGIPGMSNHKLNGVQGKLGLSATPDRWWDETGTSMLRNYFSDTVYAYDMEKAIANGILTEYEYTPIVVGLDQDEKELYIYWTKKIMYLLQNKKDDEEIEKANRNRMLILSKARQKKQVLYKILAENSLDTLSHTLVYCAKGEVEEITKALSEFGVRVHRFDSKIDIKTRESVLTSFDAGHIQVLVAIKCLDEGVDVPSTKAAYFLASTSNPREFVQRRGRILRKYKGKNIAQIYDFIVLPEDMPDETFKGIATKELPRFAEFSRYAINSFSCKKEVNRILSIRNLEYLMDKLPWEVYAEMKEKWGNK